MAVALKTIVVTVPADSTGTLLTVAGGKAIMVFGVKTSTEDTPPGGSTIGAAVSFDELGNGSKVAPLAQKDPMDQYVPYDLIGKLPMQSASKLMGETLNGACKFVVSYAELDA